MGELQVAARMTPVHSDIRGEIFMEALRMQQQGESVLKLNTGNPGAFGFGMPQSLKSVLENNMDKAVAYCDFRGMREAREAICAYHNGNGIKCIAPEDIYITNGVSEAVTMLLNAYLNPGDEMLLPSPGYSLWTNTVYLCGAKPVFYRCDEENAWNPDIDDMRRHINERTKAILLINPNNPTGAVYSEEVLREIIALAAEHDLPIFSDEIYDRLIYENVPFRSTAALASEDAVVVTTNGLSKSHLVCGFRCGWLAVSGPTAKKHALLAALDKLASMRLCSNALMQLVIPAALNDPQTPKSLVSPGGRLYEQRRAACDALEKVDTLQFVKNKGAFYVFPRIDPSLHITDDHRFAMDLLHETHILVVPGTGFDWQEQNHFRLVLLPEPHMLADAVAKIGAFLAHYHQ